MAVDDKEDSPIPSDFLDTELTMTVYEISKTTKPINGKVKVKKSFPYRIYKLNFAKGPIEISIKLDKFEKTARFIMFYGVDIAGEKEASCGGVL